MYNSRKEVNDKKFEKIVKNAHVRIHTMTGGCYDNQTGRVISKFISSQDKLTDSSWEEVSDIYPYWYRVKFDHLIHTGERFVAQDIFMPSELTIIEED